MFKFSNFQIFKFLLVPSFCLTFRHFFSIIILFIINIFMILIIHANNIVRQPSNSIWPRTQILISLSQSGHAAYFMVEYQFSIYIIEVFAKKINFKSLPHTESTFGS